MRLVKYSLLVILPVFFLSLMPELSAKSHHRHHHKSSHKTRTSVSVNMNVNARTPVYYTTPVYAPAYTTVVTQYPQQAYYEPVAVNTYYVAPAPVQQVVVQSQPRSFFSLSLSPFFSFWSN